MRARFFPINMATKRDKNVLNMILNPLMPTTDVEEEVPEAKEDGKLFVKDN
jgi:hypothetical protein